MSQPRKSLYKLLRYIPLPPAMQVCNTAAQFTCTPDKTSWFENPLSVFGGLAGRALQGFVTQSSLCLPSDGHTMPRADEQLLDEIPSSPCSMGEEVRLSFTITRFSSSPGGEERGRRQCPAGLRGGGKVVAVGSEVLVSQLAGLVPWGSAGHPWLEMLWGHCQKGQSAGNPPLVQLKRCEACGRSKAGRDQLVSCSCLTQHLVPHGASSVCRDLQSCFQPPGDLLPCLAHKISMSAASQVCQQ